MPALAGVTAATLAGEGFAGYHEALEDPLGYFTLTCERPVPEEAVEGLGEVWQTEKLVNKPYPVCGWTLAPVEGTIELVRTHNLKAEEIVQIQVRVPVQTAMGGTMWKADQALSNIRERHDWSYIPLLFEMTYPVAAAAVDGELTPRQWKEERIFDPVIQQMMKRVSYVTDLGLTTAYLREDKLGAGVVITTTDGRRIEKEVPVARGSSENPMDVKEKFLLCARDVIGEARSERALELLSVVEDLEDVGKLASCFLKA
jgi:2-methylcitrate dehydratase PrpD